MIEAVVEAITATIYRVDIVMMRGGRQGSGAGGINDWLALPGYATPAISPNGSLPGRLPNT